MISNLKDLWHKLTAVRAINEGEVRREYIANVLAERERLLAAERAQARRQAALFRLSAELAATLEETEACRRVLDGLHDTLGYDVLALYLVDETTGDRVLAASVGSEPPTRIPPRQGLSERPLLDGQLHYTPDVIQDPLYVPGVGGSEVDVPVRIGGKVLGVLVAESREPHAFNQDDFEVLTAAAQQTGLAIEKARLFEAEERRAEQFRVIGEVGRRMTSILPVGELLWEIARLIKETLGYYLVGIALIEGDELVFKAGAGGVWETPQFQPPRLQLAREGITGWVAWSGKPLLVPDVSQESRYYSLAEASEIRSELAVPLKTKEAVIGVLHVQSDRLNAFDESDLEVLQSLANQAAIAIENARLYDQAQREIVERVRAEAELQKYQEHLEELVEERTAELRESEERYRTLFDGIPVGLYRTTPAGQILDANLAMVQMLGYPSREDLLAINSASLYTDPEERVEWKALMEREGVVRDSEIRDRRYDGTVIWVNDTARAVKDEQGQVLYYEGSLEDITERKRVEAELRKYQEQLEELVEERSVELRESEERYRTLFDGVPVGLYRTTPAGQILDANLAFVQMVGYPDRETLLAVNTATFYMDPEEQVQWRALLEREGVVRDFEARGRRYDGPAVWFSDTARAVRDEQGQVLYYEGSLEDITGRKKLEEEIRRQKDYFEALFVNNPVAVLTADLDANVVSWNPAAEKLFGYTQEEAIGQNVDDLVAHDPRIREEALRYTNQALTIGRLQATTKRTRKDGSFVDVEVLVLPVVVAGEKVGFIAIYHDVSELQEARRAAEAANQAKSAFLANMSHELRTPLNAILGFTQLMNRDPNLTAEQQENVGIINRSGEHLLALINDVLEMSKIEAGRVTLQETNFDLYRLLDGLEEMFGLRAKDKGLTLSFERAENVPQYVRTDEGKLRQVLSNLLGNAVKFTQEGGVALRVRYAPLPGPPPAGGRESDSSLPDGERGWRRGSSPRLLFEVEDTGLGIAPEELAAVFDPFVQATRRQQSQEGTGLGLSISRQYVRLMGGDINVSSQLGQGSLFKFDVQGRLADAAVVQVAQPRRRVLELEPNQPIYRLLIAEDKETNRQLLVKLLEPLGFEVKEAVNGQEALEIWERWEPHLIWMDMRMPVMDGYEATRRIKATTKGQATVIIALTATAFEEDRERMLLEGCDDFVRKPFREDEIFERLAKHLGVRFIYEEQTPPAAVQPTGIAAPPADVLTPAALAVLPAGWVADLQQATIKADLSLVLTLIDQIRGQNPALADALADLAHNFGYKKILMLIEKPEDEDES